ncbi:choice-of-anchor Q domain-containing protein [Niabella hirudinis]|uniref:choice-of-anchor Q domain-containing protein n=1 Tax=Niabella hirudinis TaxID=1285929 RepID=UPI003EBB166E
MNRTFIFRKCLIALIILSHFSAAAQTPDANGIVYVKKNAGGNGSSWSSATSELADALKAAKTNTNIKEIWVAKGNYKPLYRADDLSGTTAADNRYSAFVLVKNVKVYGGFDPDVVGGATTSSPATAITTLNGDVDGDNTIGNNAYHVVMAVGDMGTAALDGFTVTGGNANVISGGVIIVNGSAVGRYEGGGLYISDGAPKISRVIIEGNNASQGGGLYAYNAASEMSEIIVRNNSAESYFGGGITIGSGPSATTSVQLRNALIVNNSATAASGRGGGIYTANYGAAVPLLTNVTIGNNAAASGGGVYILAGSVKINNSIIWANTTGGSATTPGADIYGGSAVLKNSIAQVYNSADPANLVGSDPLFSNPANGDYRLLSASPAINKGNNDLYAGLNAGSKDLAGNARVYHYASAGIIDMGSYESAYTPGAAAIVYVKPVATGNGDGTSWDDATSDLQGAIDAAGTQKVFVAVGNYNVPSPKSFIMKNGVAVYGGFDPDHNIRTLADNRIMMDTSGVTGSILNGKHERPVIWNVFTAATAMNGTAVLDGFTITGGYNGIVGLYDGGGGMRNEHASPTINNVVFRANAAYNGGGMLNHLFSGPVLTNTAFVKDSATHQGGGILNYSSAATTMNGALITHNYSAHNGAGITNYATVSQKFTNLVITKNIAANAGGGIENINSSTTFINTLVADNTQGIIASGSNAPTFINCTIARNYTVFGETSFYSVDGNINFINSIVFGAFNGKSIYTAKNSFIEGSSNTDNGNIDPGGIGQAQLFNAPGLGDYTLLSTAPVINKGSDALFGPLDQDTKDLAGNSRVMGSAIDMGAYEFGGSVLPVTFGAFSAVVKDGQLLVSWTTETETNNDHFLVQLSTDGWSWKTVQMVQSKAAYGNSDRALEYDSTVPLTALSLGAGLLLLSVMAGRRQYNLAMALGVLCVLSYSCSKRDVFKNMDNGKLFVRIVQVDKNGTERISKVIRAVQE